MRRRIVVIVLAAVVAGVAAGVIAPEVVPRHDRKAAPLARGSVTLVGDSLNVGIEPYLEEALAGWEIEADDVVGRSSAAGLERLRAHAGGLGRYVVVSLGTNDPVGAVDDFRATVAEALRLAAGSCVVWAAIRRDGDAYEPFNDVLRAAATGRPALRLVDWPAMVAAHPAWLVSDGVHGTPEGYRARAQAVLDAMRACPAPA
jgi:lysophospholipase L1-like esterase